MFPLEEWLVLILKFWKHVLYFLISLFYQTMPLSVHWGGVFCVLALLKFIMMCLCLLFNEVDFVFSEISVGYITLVNASSMRWNLVLLDKVPRVDRMPNKVQYFIEKNVSVVMKGYLLSWNEYWIQSNLLFSFFFSQLWNLMELYQKQQELF